MFAGILLVGVAEVGSGESRSVDVPVARAYYGGSRDPISWSPFLRVGARTLRTEQCAKSQCVYPVDLGRCGSRACQLDGRTEQHHRKADPGVLLGEVDFPTTNPKPAVPAGPNGSLRRV